MLRWAPAPIAPLILLWLLMQGFLRDPSIGTPTFHFFIVSLASGLSLFLSLFILIAARQVRDARDFFLGLAFFGTAGVFLVHALTTPGAFVPEANVWIGLSARLSLLVGASFLGLSSTQWRSTQSEAILNRWSLILLAVVGAIALYGYVALSDSAAASSEYGGAPAAAATPPASRDAAYGSSYDVSTSANAPVDGKVSYDVEDLLGSQGVAIAITTLTVTVLDWVTIR
jgi:hypothetical protein